MFVGTLIELLKKPTHLVSSRFTKVGLKPGDLLTERYMVMKVLSRGGWGETYIARDLHRPGTPRCVIKVLKPSTDDPVSLGMAEELFNREAETLERLGQHKQIPLLLAYFQANRNFYLVQEFIDGFPLDTELYQGIKWSESKVISLLIETLNILTFVHNQQVIHRDVKPSNLIRRRYDSKLVLIDFGAVKQIRESQGSNQTQADPLTVSIGTKGYMPHEQFAGMPQPSSDIYALGVICIQAMTGIEAENLPRNRDDEIIWRSHTQITGPLIEIVDKMVALRCSDRYPSAEEVLRDIERAFPDKVENYRAVEKQEKSPPKDDPFWKEDNVILKKYSRRSSIPLMAAGIGTLLLLLSSPIILDAPFVQNFRGYAALNSSLRAKDWEAADQATLDLMLGLVGKESKKRGVFISEEWENFLDREASCEHVERIDSRWVSASNGTLGFSVQKRFFQEAVARGDKDHQEFLTNVGWIGEGGNTVLVDWNYDKATGKVIYTEGKEPNFDNPAEGHLPAKMSWEDSRDRRFRLLVECNL